MRRRRSRRRQPIGLRQPPPRWFIIALVSILVWACFIRLWGVSDRPFWREEAWVASAAAATPWSEVFSHPEIPAPPLFLAAVKAGGSILGPPELGYRLPCLLAGLLLVPLIMKAAQRLRLARTAALAVAVLAASSWMLATWSRELQPYIFEAFLSILRADGLSSASRERRGSRFWMKAAGICGVCFVGPWLGYGVAFPFIALLIAWPMLPVKRRGRSLLAAAIAAGALAVSLGLLARQVGSGQINFLSPHRAVGTAFIDPAAMSSWMQAARRAAATSVYLIWPPAAAIANNSAATVFLGGITWMLTICGLLYWPRRTRRVMIVWVFVPWVLMAVASMCELYPFSLPRMMIWAAPPIVLAAAMGLMAIGREISLLISGRTAPGIGPALAVTAILVLVNDNIPWPNAWWIHHDFPRLLHTLDTEREGPEGDPADPVLVALTASPSVKYYRGDADASF
ncbi:MAG: hypothetical protein ACYTFO_09950, partial [Planctomycetota bacterium]